MSTEIDVVSAETSVPAARSTGRRVAVIRDYGVVACVLLLFVGLSLTSDVFLSTTNLINVLDQWSLLGIIACGMTINIIAGGFDLSVSAVFALAGVVAAKVANATGDVGLGLLAGFAAGAVLGTVNGFLITYGRLDKFVGTIATSAVFLGVAELVTQNQLIVVEDDGFGEIGNGYIGSLTTTSVVFLVVAGVSAFVLAKTVIGHRWYAVGGNAEAARYAGLPLRGVQVLSYTASGVCAGIAGVLAASRNSTASADLRVDFAFVAATAIVIGGVSVFGGRGNIGRAVLGIALLALIGNGFNLLDIDPTYQGVLQGAIIVIAMTVDAWARRSSV